MKHYEQYAGNLGYYGLSSNPNYNVKVKRANRLVDIYNRNVTTYEGSKQFNYQNRILRKIYKTLGI